MTIYCDRRQLVCTRLYALMTGLTIPLLGGENGPVTIVPGSVVHNRNQLQHDKVPGIILLDADEVRDPRATALPQGSQASRVREQVMKMTPEIYVVLDVRGATKQNIGEDLNLARMAILRAVLPDAELQGIVGTNGGITYDGCVTDLARNRTMKGQLGISITFNYPLLNKEYVGIPG